METKTKKKYTFEGVPHAMRMAMEKIVNRGPTPEDVQLEKYLDEHKKESVGDAGGEQ